MKKVSLMVFLAVFSLTAAAQNPQKLSLTLQQAKDYAVEYNRTLQNASLDVKKAHAVRWQTIATMLPNVTAGYAYQNSMGYEIAMENITKNPLTGQDTTVTTKFPMPPNGNFTIQVGVQISGAQIVGALLQNIAVEMADISKKQTEQTTNSTTTQLYMSALANQQIVNLLNANKSNVEKMYNSTLEAVKVGSMEQTEADKIYVQVMKIESGLNSAQRGLEILYNSLKLHLGINADMQLELVDNLDNFTNAEAALELLHTDFNINQNYNYQLLKNNLKLSKRQVTLAGMDYLPSVTVGYQYSNLKYFSEKGGGFRMTPPNAFSLSVSMPLFTSGRTFEKIAEKKIDYQKAKNSFDDTENQLKIQDKQLRYDLNSSYENFQIQKKNIEVTQRVFNNVSEKFNYGKASSLEVTQASTDFISAQNSYIQSLIDMVNAQVALRNLLNK
ncbi:MAG: TolC family protein [Prevotellaceae bacterium]|jgi:outer membrane protein TolC|nr:TolC family protein [Prevotellaceae bacterium]